LSTLPFIVFISFAFFFKVFNRTQDFERERLSFFKDIFNSLHGALNVCAKVNASVGPAAPTLLKHTITWVISPVGGGPPSIGNYDSIYSELAESISQCDVEADLNLWSSNHGVDMPFVSPQFEEYSPDLAYITGKKRATLTDPDSPVTLTNITMISHPFDHESNEITSNNSRSNNNNHNKKSENTIVSSANGRNSE
uniref:Bestrophin homolog n=1 Tax=Schistosoma curassoni TaxID=6186 RepID=A0A183JEM7_9TREM